MKKLLGIIIVIVSCMQAEAQEKEPVQVERVPTVFGYTFHPYYDYTDQGRKMYINNSQFYNGDNAIRHAVPTGNGQYIKPGNSNPLNQKLNRSQGLPAGTIFNGGIPLREYGTPVAEDQGFLE